MSRRPYYSTRTGKNPDAVVLTLDALRKLFQTLFTKFEYEGYFQHSLGYHCVDNGFISGEVGHDLEGFVLLALRKTGLTPIRERIAQYTEDDLFDMIEFLYDHCAHPTKRTFHSWNSCGWHASAWDVEAGRSEFRQKINDILNSYASGYELSAEGQVLELAADGLRELVAAEMPVHDPGNVEGRIYAARQKFLRHAASLDDRRDAVRELAAVLEFLRPQLQLALEEPDERDLFNLANNFGIRHHNSKQKVKYDTAIWYSWMFYYYLATLHAALGLIARGKNS